MKHFLYATLFLSVFVMCASAVELQDVDKTNTMYSVGDPFGLAQLATRAGTQELNAVSAQVNATNSLFQSYFTSIWARTNSWDTAFSWGNHAGLYRDILWVPAWSEVTNKPSTFPPSAHTHEHSALGELDWLTSAHTGTPARIAGFFEGGAAGYAGFGAGMYLDGSDNISVSNEVISGAALGATAIQPASTNGWITAPTATNIAQAVIAPYTNAIDTAWQNPPSATNWMWTSDGTQITLTNYNFASLDVVIPDMLDGLPVTGFGIIFSPEQAGTAITSVSGGRNVTTIGNSAFYGCTNLTSVILPQATTIGDAAFYQCSSLTSVSLPQATTIGTSAFDTCSSLTSVSLPQATTIGNDAFLSCSSLTSVNLPQATTIGIAAFSSCSSLTSVSLPQVTTIENGAFLSCTNLTSVILPQATTIGNSAFYNCSSLTSVSLPQATTIEYGAFYKCPSLTSVSFAQNAPAEATGVYTNSPSVTNYVTNPTATGWGPTFGDRPVVRLDMYGNVIGNATTATTVTGSQSNLIAGAVQNNDTRYLASVTNNQTDVSLGLASGSTVATATAGSEPVSLDQALSLLSASSTVYLSPTVFTEAQVATTNRSLSSMYSPTAWTVVYSGSVTAGQYLFSFTAPSNLVTSVLAGNQTANLYMTYAGSGGSTLTCKMEGYIFNPATTSSVDYAETSASFAVAKTGTLPATPQQCIAVIPTTTNLTGNLRYQIRIKAITASSVQSVTMWGGSNSISSVSFPVADSVMLGSRGATSIESAQGVAGTYDSTARKLTMPTNTASETSVTFTPTNYTASAQNVEAHLGGIDARLAYSNTNDASTLSSGTLPMGRLTTTGTNLIGAVLITDGVGNRSWTNGPSFSASLLSGCPIGAVPYTGSTNSLNLGTNSTYLTIVKPVTNSVRGIMFQTIDGLTNLVIDSINNYVGINIVPTVALDVKGAMKTSGNADIGGTVGVQGGLTLSGVLFLAAYGSLEYGFRVTGDFSGSNNQWRYYTSSGKGGTGGNGTNQTFMCINPTWKQTGTAGATDLKIDRTETTVGSGSQYLIQAQVNSVNKFTVDNNGNATMSNLTANGLSYIILPTTAQTNGLASGILYNDAGTIKVMP